MRVGYSKVNLFTVTLFIIIVLIAIVHGLTGLVPAFVGVSVTVVFFVLITVTLLTARWRVMVDCLEIRSFLSSTKYPLARIKKIYLAQAPSDPKALLTSIKFTRFIQALLQRTGRPFPANYDNQTIKDMAQRVAPLQVWIDMLETDGTVGSYPLVERNTIKRRKLAPILEVLMSQLPPDTIENQVIAFLRQ